MPEMVYKLAGKLDLDAMTPEMASRVAKCHNLVPDPQGAKDKELGERVRAACKAHGVTAAALRCWAWAQGAVMQEHDFLYDLAAALDVDGRTKVVQDEIEKAVQKAVPGMVAAISSELSRRYNTGSCNTGKGGQG